MSGVGIGLRDPHVTELLSGEPKAPWVELLADNHLAEGGLIAARLEAICERYPLTLHCVGMNLGGVEPLDRKYLQAVKHLMMRSRPAWVSDHLCFTRHGGHHYHDLLPLPYTEEALFHMVDRISQVQDFLGTRLLVENVSAYIAASDSSMDETEFLTALVNEADCDLLLDVNNLYVSQVNLGLDAGQVIAGLPVERIREVHLAGYEDKDGFLIDAHNNPVSEPVWTLFEALVARVPQVPVLIEWDNDIPSLDVLLAEAARAKAVIDRIGVQAA